MFFFSYATHELLQSEGKGDLVQPQMKTFEWKHFFPAFFLGSILKVSQANPTPAPTFRPTPEPAQITIVEPSSLLYFFDQKITIIWRTSQSSISSCAAVDIFLYKDDPSVGIPERISQIEDDYPNDIEALAHFIPAELTNPDTNHPFGDAIVGVGYEVRLQCLGPNAALSSYSSKFEISLTPSSSPTKIPTPPPTRLPTFQPTSFPTRTRTPTHSPTHPPTVTPTSPWPSTFPTFAPSSTPAPSISPTISPTGLPSPAPLGVEMCAGAPDYAEDRRHNKTRLRLAHWNVDFLMLPNVRSSGSLECPCAEITCSGGECGTDCCGWGKMDAQAHLLAVAAELIALDADIVHLAEVGDCNVLRQLLDLLPRDHGYVPYMVENGDLFTGQHVALLTRVDPIEDLVFDERTAEYPVDSMKPVEAHASACALASAPGQQSLSKNLMARFDVDGLDGPFTLVGLHLLAIPDSTDRCGPREAQALVASWIAHDALSRGDQVVVVGDFNDYDDETPQASGIPPITAALAILRNSSGNGTLLHSAASAISTGRRYSEWYDRDGDCIDDGMGTLSAAAELSLLDHMLFSTELWERVHADSVSFHHSRLPPRCLRDGGFYGDHWPLTVDVETHYVTHGHQCKDASLYKEMAYVSIALAIACLALTVTAVLSAPRLAPGVTKFVRTAKCIYMTLRCQKAKFEKALQEEDDLSRSPFPSHQAQRTTVSLRRPRDWDVERQSDQTSSGGIALSVIKSPIHNGDQSAPQTGSRFKIPPKSTPISTEAKRVAEREGYKDFGDDKPRTLPLDDDDDESELSSGLVGGSSVITKSKARAAAEDRDAIGFVVEKVKSSRKGRRGFGFLKEDKDEKSEAEGEDEGQPASECEAQIIDSDHVRRTLNAAWDANSSSDEDVPSTFQSEVENVATVRGDDIGSITSMETTQENMHQKNDDSIDNEKILERSAAVRHAEVACQKADSFHQTEVARQEAEASCQAETIRHEAEALGQAEATDQEVEALRQAGAARQGTKLEGEAIHESTNVNPTQQDMFLTQEARQPAVEVDVAEDIDVNLGDSSSEAITSEVEDALKMVQMALGDDAYFGDFTAGELAHVDNAMVLQTAMEAQSESTSVVAAVSSSPLPQLPAKVGTEVGLGIQNGAAARVDDDSDLGIEPFATGASGLREMPPGHGVLGASLSNLAESESDEDFGAFDVVPTSNEAQPEGNLFHASEVGVEEEDSDEDFGAFGFASASPFNSAYEGADTTLSFGEVGDKYGSLLNDASQHQGETSSGDVAAIAARNASAAIAQTASSAASVASKAATFSSRAFSSASASAAATLAAASASAVATSKSSAARDAKRGFASAEGEEF